MIIMTKELLRHISPCVEGYRFGLAQDAVFGKPYDFSIQICKDNGEYAFAEFLEECKESVLLVEYTGGVSTGTFYVTDHDIGKRYAFSNVEDAKQKSEELKKQFFDKRFSKIIVNHVTHLENGAEITEPVDLDNTEHTDNFALFNDRNGVYEQERTLEAAKQRRSEMLAEIMAEHASHFIVFEEIRNEEGWTALKVVPD